VATVGIGIQGSKWQRTHPGEGEILSSGHKSQMHAWILLPKYKFKGKIRKNFKTVIAEH
jgi:hypothetical protein